MNNKMNSKQYEKFIKSKLPKPNIIKNCIMAFVIGGIICDIGQLITNMLKNMGKRYN